jgi:hypothetical protein
MAVNKYNEQNGNEQIIMNKMANDEQSLHNNDFADSL